MRILCFLFLLSSLVSKGQNRFAIGYNFYDPLSSSFHNHELLLQFPELVHTSFKWHLGYTGTPGFGRYCKIGHPYEDYQLRGWYTRMGVDVFPFEFIKKHRHHFLIGAQALISRTNESAFNKDIAGSPKVKKNSAGYGGLIRSGIDFRLSSVFFLECSVNYMFYFQRDSYLLPPCTTFQPGIGTRNLRPDLILKYHFKQNNNIVRRNNRKPKGT